MKTTPAEALRLAQSRILEDCLVDQLRRADAPAPTREHRFSPPRRWRFDLAWPDLMLAVEVEGGVWVRGRHTRPQGFINDCEKYNTATLQGWRVLRVTDDMIYDGRACEWTLQAVRGPLKRLNTTPAPNARPKKRKA